MGWIILVIILMPFFATEAFFSILMAIFAIGIFVCISMGEWLWLLIFIFGYFTFSLIVSGLDKGKRLF